jgi:tryptophan synthase alpha chain
VSEELEKRVSKIKKQTNLPVVVGFGIKDAETANKMSKFSDGVVVGSKLVDEISKHPSSEDNLLKQNLTSIIEDLKLGIS